MEEKKLPKELELKLEKILEENYEVIDGIVRISRLRDVDKEWLYRQYFDGFIEYLYTVKDIGCDRTDEEHRKEIISLIQSNINEGIRDNYEQAFFDVNGVIENEIGKETYDMYFNEIRDWVGDHLMVGFTAKEIETFNFYNGGNNND